MNVRFDAFLQGRQRADDEFWGDIRRQQEYVKGTMEMNRLLDDESSRNDQRQAATYLSPLMSYWQQAADNDILDHEWLTRQREAIQNDPNFQRFSPEVQQAVWSKLGESGLQIANRLRSQGNVDAARQLMRTFGVTPEAAPSATGVLDRYGVLGEGTGYQLAQDGRTLLDTRTGTQLPVDAVVARISGRDPSAVQALLSDLFLEQGQLDQQTAASDALRLSTGMYVRDPATGTLVYSPTAVPGASGGAAAVSPAVQQLYQDLGVPLPAAPASTGTTPPVPPAGAAGTTPALPPAGAAGTTPALPPAGAAGTTPALPATPTAAAPSPTELSQLLSTVLAPQVQQAQAQLEAAQQLVTEQQAAADALNAQRWRQALVAATPGAALAERPETQQLVQATLDNLFPPQLRDAAADAAGAAVDAGGTILRGIGVPLPAAPVVRQVTALSQLLDSNPQLDTAVADLNRARQQAAAAQEAFDQIRAVQSQPLAQQMQTLVPLIVQEASTPDGARAMVTRSRQQALGYGDMLAITFQQPGLDDQTRLAVGQALVNLREALNNGN